MATTTKKATAKTSATETSKKPAAKKTASGTTTSATAKKTSATAATKTSTTKAAKPAEAKAAAPKKAPAARKSTKKTSVTPEQRYHMIATAAYYLAERRGFTTGYEMQDWIAAEADIDSMLKA